MRRLPPQRYMCLQRTACMMSVHFDLGTCLLDIHHIRLHMVNREEGDTLCPCQSCNTDVTDGGSIFTHSNCLIFVILPYDDVRDGMNHVPLNAVISWRYAT